MGKSKLELYFQLVAKECVYVCVKSEYSLSAELQLVVITSTKQGMSCVIHSLRQLTAFRARLSRIFAQILHFSCSRLLFKYECFITTVIQTLE